MLVAVSALVLGAVAPSAHAVKFGQPDTENKYPWVGLMVAVDPADPHAEPLWRCTGSLLSETLFLTAGHCVGDPGAPVADQPVTVYIWFAEGAEIIQTDPVYLANLARQAANPKVDINLCEGVSGYPCGGYDAVGTPEAHPNWNGALTIPQTSDVGVVNITSWTGFMPEPYGVDKVAPVGYLDNLATPRGKGNVEFTVVGYGLQSVRPVESAVKQRMVGTVSLVNLRSALAGGWNLHYSNNPGQGHGGSGGTCFGDSGGPVLHNGYIVAVNSFVLNGNCQGAGFGYRVDTQYAHSFIFG